jgi:hypothetical protein
MTSEKQAWRDFIGWCEREIAERRDYLRPLEEGSVHTGKKSPDTGGVWKDTTQDDIDSLKREIASIEAVIAQNRHRAD